MKERWAAVPGYEDCYEVSSTGRVRRVGSGRGSIDGRLLTLGKHRGGYRTASLWHGNEAKSFLVHRLVMMAFSGPCPEGREVNHRNGDKADNRLENLEYVTRQENIDHAVETGLIANKGEGNSQSKLSAGDVQRIRGEYRPGGGPGYKALARRYGVTWGAVRNIVKRRNWEWLAE